MAREFVDVTKVNTIPDFDPGFVFQSDDGKSYVYVRCGEAGFVAGLNVRLTAGHVAMLADADNDRIFGVVVAPDGDIDLNDYCFVQVGGVYENANVATGVSSGDLLAINADANGDFQPTVAANTVIGDVNVRAVALEAESAGLADVMLTRTFG